MFAFECVNNLVNIKSILGLFVKNVNPLEIAHLLSSYFMKKILCKTLSTISTHLLTTIIRLGSLK